MKKNQEKKKIYLIKLRDFLLKWFNYHLKNSGCNKEIINFNDNIKDGEKYNLLLNNLDPNKCDKISFK